ncbi:hypothetical protein AMTR_s00072p00122060 [Amborella trichopoda]|uniref:Uncharacterized protein n=1 Tax=Amborella trichopoda TaxID=13333 RepID=W1NTG0_AMBTC|nr:hypothetical protein AMTR_s00072p00122060 [Amborella trichopoda]
MMPQTDTCKFGLVDYCGGLAVLPDRYAHNSPAKVQGGLSVAVPGELLGLHEAWKKHGRLPWKELVKPAIALAEIGFRVSPFLSFEMEQSEDAIRRDPGLREKHERWNTTVDWRYMSTLNLRAH